MQLLETSLVLEVSFSVKVLRLNISKATWVAGFHQNKVCREILILHDLDDLAHS